MEFTIDRSRWRCGGGDRGPDVYPEWMHGEGETMLLNDDGFMCCLGQVEEQLGVGLDRLLQVFKPSGLQVESILCEIDHDAASVPDADGNEAGDIYIDTELASRAMSINDDETLDDENREHRLTALFETHGHTITFTGEFA